MLANNPYRSWVSGFARRLNEGRTITTAGLIPPERPPIPAEAPTVLIFAPHPDDEAIIGGLPLRLRRELRFNVVNVALTLGSRKERRAARRRELQNACDYLGFSLLTAHEGGLEGINTTTRGQQPERWSAAVAAITDILAVQRPTILFMPHAGDWNKTHIGAHYLVLDALGRLPDFACYVVETEFWGTMDTPNLLIESSVTDVADLVAALALHVGEVARNPYHLRLPAWMMDNVRRGAELVGGQGAAAPAFAFATLYRLRRWTPGGLQAVLDSGRMLACGDDLSELFR